MSFYRSITISALFFTIDSSMIFIEQIKTRNAEQTYFLGLHCVLASGILISSNFPFLNRITQVYLHFGQNRGKSSNTVCASICVRVFPPHLGQISHSDCSFFLSDRFMTFPPVQPISHLCMLDLTGFLSYLRRISLNCWR